MKHFISLVLIGLMAAGCQTKEAKAPKIPMENFFKNGVKSSFRISPDGKYFSFRADYKGMMNIYIQNTEDTTAQRVTNDTLRSINRYFWKKNKIVYQQDIGGDENFQIFSVNPDGSGFVAHTPFPGIRSEIIDDLSEIPGKENQLLVMINKRTKEYFDPFILDLETNELTLQYDNKENYDSWITDNTGTIRMATKTDGVNITYYYRNSGQEPFSKLITTNFREAFYPQAFDAQNRNIYLLSNIGRDKIALVEYDPIANKEIKELYSNPKYDMSYAIYDRKKQNLVSVNWDAEKTEKHFFDKDWELIQNNLEQKFTNYQVNFVSLNDERTKGIVWKGNDQLPAMFYLYDFGNGQTTEIANPFPWLKESELANMKPITFKSRDGLTINGYLTLPKGEKPQNLPVVVNPHGGPWARDTWGYNPEVQLLANRGYAVLQLNFRGSTGYGRQFWEASFKQWGKNMQNDITDGVKWLISEGIADSSRIAIYGGSYGGYATLVGITFTPDLYAAAIDYVGISNLFTFMNTIPPYWKPYLDQFYEMVGNPQKDSLLLAEASPVFYADKIKTPLFIAQGANDPRVNKAESDQMVEALKKRGVDVEYMVKDNEGHGFANEKNRFDFYGAMEKFLEKHLAAK